MSKNSIEIEAPLETVTDLLADIERYPTWSTGIKSATIDEKDGSGRPVKVTSAIDAGVMKEIGRAHV